MTVKHLLEQKGQSLWTIDPDATVLDALAKMAEKDIGSLVVMDGEELIGHHNRETLFPECHSQRQKVPHHAGQGHHGEKRSPCPARTVGRGMHGPDDR